MATKDNAEDALIPYSRTPSSYNYGPRTPTDVLWGRAFVLALVVFTLWGSIGTATVKRGGFDDMDSAPFWGNYSYNSTDGSCFRQLHANSDEGGLTPTQEMAEVVMIPLAISIFAAFLFGAVLLFGFKRAANTMVWVVVAVKVIGPGALGIYLLAHGESYHVDDEDTTMRGGFNIPAWLLIGISLLLAALFWCMRVTLAMVAKLFQVSVGALQDNMAMIPVQSGIAFVTMLVKFGLVLLTAGYISYGVVAPVEVLDVDGTLVGHKCQWGFAGTTTEAFAVFAAFTIYWFAMWALTTRTYIIGDCVSYWYWHGPERGSLTRAVKHGTYTHFGSMAFAGLVLVIVEQLKEMARKKTDNWFVCIIQAIVRCILDYIEYLCKMSVIVVGITGEGFWSAGKRVVSLFTESFGNMALSTGLWWIPDMVLGFFVFLIAACWGVGTGYVVNAAVHGMTPEHCGAANGGDCADLATTYGIGVGVAAGLVVLYVLAFFANIMTAFIDTIFLCFLIDKSKGIVTKPEIHEVIGRVLERQGKTIPDPSQYTTNHLPPPQYNTEQPAPAY